ncbi:hypothetical protein Fmac_023676 [Flemingia macrophylla]|uniref:Histidine decarboxylase n=1 Tax=Flemingia macrophylla TaxID=520843 RepID=A0ABD1LMR3_9FABA
MTVNLIPSTHATVELFPTVVSNAIAKLSIEEEKHIDIDIDNIEENTYSRINLPITYNIGDTQTNLASLISNYLRTLNSYYLRNLGYPTNQVFNYEALVPLLNFHLNNAGDPFLGSSFSLNSTAFEVCVLDWFANLWEIENNEYWRYVTTGGTEGNLHGILVRTLVLGEIDCVDLKALLVAHNDKPAIINLNIGTTMKGGVNDLDLVIQTLQERGFTSDRFYIHCDGALFGIMLPFIERAPRISFKKGIGSVAISGHKILGCPIPCGIVIIKALSRDVEYIASRDVTITGSRCGHAPIFLWYGIKRKGIMGLKNEVQKCIMNARYLHHRLRDAEIGAILNEFSNIVVFEKPLDENFTRRWNLACTGNIAHVVVMQHVTIEMLDSFVREFLRWTLSTSMRCKRR